MEDNMKAAFVMIAIFVVAGVGCTEAVTTKSSADASRPAPATTDAGYARAEPRTPDSLAQPALVAPRPLTPADGTTLSEFPRKTKVTWEPVLGAAVYKVEVEYQDADSQWHPNGLAAESKSTKHEFEFVGAQPGRWRVWAVDATGQEGPKSEWWTFRYTQ
jgi:hypothetical protein